jgi:hypothetical protein
VIDAGASEKSAGPHSATADGYEEVPCGPPIALACESISGLTRLAGEENYGEVYDSVWDDSVDSVFVDGDRRRAGREVTVAS